jgi:heptose I phosphotransferase
VLVIAKYHDLLRQLGLDSLDGVARFSGELVKNHKGRRDIHRIRAQAGSLGLTLYLKRNFTPYKKDGLRSLITRGAVWSQSRVEWENSLALQRAGISVAEPIAFGEECGFGWEKSSFILTAAAGGQLTLDSFLREERDPRARRKVFDALGGQIRRMHDAGFASPDLFTRHVFVDISAEPAFCLIDMARLDHRRPMPSRLRARDLAALHVTAPLRQVTARERLRFMRVYGGDSRLRKQVLERARHLLTRRKFADFSAAS